MLFTGTDSFNRAINIVLDWLKETTKKQLDLYDVRL